MNLKSILAPICVLFFVSGCSKKNDTPPTAQETQDAVLSSSARIVDLGNGVKMTFVIIPPGSFRMGWTENDDGAISSGTRSKIDLIFRPVKPARKVIITKAFYMGRYEVTVGQFRKFADSTHYITDAERRLEEWKKKYGSPEDPQNRINAWSVPRTFRHPGFGRLADEAKDDHPVVCVSWNDARKFAGWLNSKEDNKPAGWVYRLPTEAEWEYAAREPQSLAFPWGNTWNMLSCNSAGRKAIVGADTMEPDDGFQWTAPVGSFSPTGDSPFGVCDMAGNVSEWCQDRLRWYEDRLGSYDQEEEGDPLGHDPWEVRALRGGDWRTAPGLDLCCARHGQAPDFGDFGDGFRLVLVRQATEPSGALVPKE